jgi:hypothetical protein
MGQAHNVYRIKILEGSLDEKGISFRIGSRWEEIIKLNLKVDD